MDDFDLDNLPSEDELTSALSSMASEREKADAAQAALSNEDDCEGCKI